MITPPSTPAVLREPVFKQVCAWCSRTIRKGTPGAPISHGCCNRCLKKQLRQIDKMRK